MTVMTPEIAEFELVDRIIEKHRYEECSLIGVLQDLSRRVQLKD